MDQDWNILRRRREGDQLNVLTLMVVDLVFILRDDILLLIFLVSFMIKKYLYSK